MGRGGVDVDAVGLGRRLADAGACADLDLREIREVRTRALGDVRFDLVGDDRAGRPDKMSKNRSVIAGARADVDGRLAFLHGERVDRERVQRRLPVVDPPSRVDRDQHVVVEADQVAVGRAAVEAAEPICQGGGPAKSSRATAAKAFSILGSRTPARRVISAA